MHHTENLDQIKRKWHGSLKSYIIGFAASIVLTALSFALVAIEPFSNEGIVLTIAGLALTQAIIQLLFFLHVGQESKPKWETLVFAFMVLVLLIIVLGSLWIMNDLHERMMPEQMEMTHD